jgi:hypothetical protein
MQVRYLAAITLLVACGTLAPACVATVDSTPADEPDEPGANMAPSEPIGEAAQALVCECSVINDWCATVYGSGHCVIGFNACTKTPKFGCGTLGLYPCTGWCVRP